MPAQWDIDTSRWPIAIHQIWGRPSDQEVDAYCDAGTRILRKKERHVTILDSTRLEKTTSYGRMKARQWQVQHHEELKHYCLGAAYVLPSAVQRFILMTVLLFTQMPVPIQVFRTQEEALGWAEAQLRLHRLR